MRSLDTSRQIQNQIFNCVSTLRNIREILYRLIGENFFELYFLYVTLRDTKILHCSRTAIKDMNDHTNAMASGKLFVLRFHYLEMQTLKKKTKFFCHTNRASEMMTFLSIVLFIAVFCNVSEIRVSGQGELFCVRFMPRCN